MNEGKTNLRAPLSRRWPGYAVAVAGTAVAALITWAHPSSAGNLPLYLIFFPVVLAAAVVGGMGPGVLATILSVLTANLLFIEQGGKLALGVNTQTTRLALFIIINLAVSIFGGQLRRKTVALRENEARLRHFIDQAPVAITMLDTQMRHIAVSRRWLTNFSLEGREVLGRNHYEVFPDIPERWKQVHQRCLAGAIESVEEDLFERANGSRQWVRWEIQPWYTAPGIIGGIVIFSEDITARVLAKEALRHSEERFRTMANAIPQLVWIARPDGSLFWFNRRCFEYTGATLEQLEGWGWQSVIDPQLLPRVLKRWRRSIATGDPYELQSRLRGADGRFRPFLTRIIPLKDKEGKVALWFGTSTDITELCERERILGRQARLIDLAPAATLVKREDGTITFWSRGAEQLYGWSKEEAIGRNVHRLLQTEFPEPLESILAKVRRGFAWTGELRHTTRDGRQVIVQSYLLSEPNAPGEMAETLESNTDITERKQLQERLEEVLEERTGELHEAVGELEHMSYSMVHDMRAPLRAMQSFAVMVRHKCGDALPPPALDYLNRISEASNRLDRLVTDALNYNKVVLGNLSLTPVNLGQLVRGMVQTYPNLHPSAADITVELTDLIVRGNESLLTQCFGNLLDNAVKFVAPGVHPHIRVWAETVDGGERMLVDTPLPDHKRLTINPRPIRVWIEDNGIGIPKEAQEKIFGMFDRVHPESNYPGTGIGLAIVRKAVQRMGGQVGLESETGRGSRFWVELPTATQAQIQEPVPRAA